MLRMDAIGDRISQLLLYNKLISYKELSTKQQFKFTSCPPCRTMLLLYSDECERNGLIR